MMAKEYTETERLEALMSDPTKLWLDGSSGTVLYSGDAEHWHTDPRNAVDDLIGWFKANAPKFL